MSVHHVIKTEITPDDGDGIISVGGLAHRIRAFEALSKKKKRQRLVKNI